MFDKQLTNFNNNILALRDFVDLIEPILQKKFKEHQSKILPLITSGIINNMLDKYGDKIEDSIRKELEGHQKDIEKKIVSLFKEKLEVKFDNIEKDDKGIKMSGLQIKAPKEVEFSDPFENVEKASNHIALLYNNSLISVLSSVEWFFSQILHYFYSKNPGSSGIAKKNLSLEDLKNLGSIKDAENHLIDLKIEDILRSSFEDWIQLLKDELKLNMGYLEDRKIELIEAYQRRNLHIHNGGIINSIYMSKVDSSLTKGLKIGKELALDKQYLDNVIGKLHLVFILIACELWKKLDPGDKNRGDILVDIIYENLLESRWEIAEGLSYFLINDSEMETVDKVVSQLNHWLCKKRLNKLEEIEEELNNADFSDKKEIFQLALPALRNETKEFFNILPAALDSKQLNVQRLEEFPIFKEIRATRKYKNFKRESKYFKEANKPVKKITTANKK